MQKRRKVQEIEGRSPIDVYHESNAARLPMDLWTQRIWSYLHQRDYLELPNVCRYWLPLVWAHCRMVYDPKWMKAASKADDVGGEAGQIMNRANANESPNVELLFSSPSSPARRICMACGLILPWTDETENGTCGRKLCKAFVHHDNETYNGVRTLLFYNHSWHSLETSDEGRPQLFFGKRTDGRVHLAQVNASSFIRVDVPDFSAATSASLGALPDPPLGMQGKFYGARWPGDNVPMQVRGPPAGQLARNDCWVTRPFDVHFAMVYDREQRKLHIVLDLELGRHLNQTTLVRDIVKEYLLENPTLPHQPLPDNLTIYHDVFQFAVGFPMQKLVEHLSSPFLRVSFNPLPHDPKECGCPYKIL